MLAGAVEVVVVVVVVEKLRSPAEVASGATSACGLRPLAP